MVSVRRSSNFQMLIFKAEEPFLFIISLAFGHYNWVTSKDRIYITWNGVVR